MNLIGLDIGTTTICGVLYSLDKKKTIRTLSRDNSFSESDIHGEYLQDPENIYSDIQTILDELIKTSADALGGLSISAQMHGILYVDNSGHAVSPYYTWQNQRGYRQIEGSSLESFISGKLGYPVYSGYGIVTHYSLMLDGQIPENAAKFCNIGDYIGMRLTGSRTPVTDITLGASMGIVDIQTGILSPSLNNLKMINMDIFPSIVSSTAILGEYQGIPVIQALGDNQASYLGSVKNKETSLLLNYGTSGQLSFYHREFSNYPHFEVRALGNEGYIHVAFSLSGGHSYKILAQFFESAANLFSPNEHIDAFDVMNGFNLDFSEESIDCLPLFLGERGGDNQSAYFRNITDINFTPENMTKALIQGMIKELHRFYQDLPEDVKDGITNIIGSGNGIRKNRHLKKAAEKSYQKPLKLLKLTEESCLGAIINAGKGIGVFQSYSEGAAEIVEYA